VAKLVFQVYNWLASGRAGLQRYDWPVVGVAHLLGGRGCASRKPLPLCLPLITCRFYEKVRIANANRFRISAASAAPPKPVSR
jgi:hypothetical protein